MLFKSSILEADVSEEKRFDRCYSANAYISLKSSLSKKEIG